MSVLKLLREKLTVPAPKVKAQAQPQPQPQPQTEPQAKPEAKAGETKAPETKDDEIAAAITALCLYLEESSDKIALTETVIPQFTSPWTAYNRALQANRFQNWALSATKK